MPIMETHVIDIDTDVVKVDVSFLLSLNNLTKLKGILDVRNDTMTSKIMKWEVPTTRKHGHLYVEWPKRVMFTVQELRKIHRHLFRSQPVRIYQRLKCSDPTKTMVDDLKGLERITKECDVCQRLATSPSRFRVAIKPIKSVFNRCVCVDLMKLGQIQFYTL